MSSTSRKGEPAGGNPVECSRCFGIFSAVFMHFVRCPALHSFCRDCIRQHANTQLEAQNTDLKCMHTSGCHLPFAEIELKAQLSEEQLMLRDGRRGNSRYGAGTLLTLLNLPGGYIRPVPAQGTSVNTPGVQPSAPDPAHGLDEGVPVVHAHPPQAFTTRPALRVRLVRFSDAVTIFPSQDAGLSSDHSSWPKDRTHGPATSARPRFTTPTRRMGSPPRASQAVLRSDHGSVLPHTLCLNGVVVTLRETPGMRPGGVPGGESNGADHRDAARVVPQAPVQTNEGAGNDPEHAARRTVTQIRRTTAGDVTTEVLRAMQRFERAASALNRRNPGRGAM
ncbi:hypothetical protein NMY22_g4669 [Coprinellus aureogranulatus]|nr:hypothetical protein NMY22_g4669 [Coprinellus aureogranulatus]